MRLYSIIKNQRIGRKSIDTVTDSGLSWETANKKRDELQNAERQAHPGRTSWTMDLYNLRLEGESVGAAHEDKSGGGSYVPIR